MANVTSAFIHSLSSFHWQSANGGSLINADHVVRYPADVGGSWALAASGLTIDSSSFTSVKGGTAVADGSYLDGNAVSMWLVTAGSACTAEPGQGPPPP